MRADTRAMTDTLVVWLTGTRLGAVALRVLESMAFAAGALMMGFVLYHGERMFFPVIREWKLNPVVRNGDTYLLSGTMVKTRPCTLVATSVMAVPKVPLAPRVLLYQIKPTEIDGGNVPTGASTWGPWAMAIPKAFLDHRDKIAWIDIFGHHRCHGFWDQETYYGRVEMGELP